MRVFKIKKLKYMKYSFKSLNVRFEFCKKMGNVALNSLMFVSARHQKGFLKKAVLISYAT